MTTIYDLPEPDSLAAKRNKALSQIIRQEIAQNNGAINFAKYMELALYHPEIGYYNAETFTLGQHGDFTTAPEISPLFAKCLARQIQQIQLQLKHNDILELGAGTGRLAYDLLIALQSLNSLPTHYYIYEISPHLRRKQRAFLLEVAPDLMSRIIWLEQLPQQFAGTIIANEVLDALPVNLFRSEAEVIQEKCVSWENDGFSWCYLPPTSAQVQQTGTQLRQDFALAAGYESELHLTAHSFIQQIAESLTSGVILFIDYGYGRAEYYHPQRTQGTLTCFYQQQKHSNPLVLTGLQDITAHVDFTEVIEIAAESGCALAGYTSQAAFLLACGLTAIAAEEEKQLSQVDEFKLHHAIKLLTMPTEMGERIKVMALSKNLATPLLGFDLHDRRRDL